MINPHQFANLILEPALKATGMYSLDAMYLMMSTALLESKLTHMKQIPTGPAMGFMQVETATYVDVVRYLGLHADLRGSILQYLERSYLPKNPVHLIGDLSLNVLVARVKYWMQTETIPSYKDIAGQAAYYKHYYNSSEGAATLAMFEKAAQDIQGWINHDDIQNA